MAVHIGISLLLGSLLIAQVASASLAAKQLAGPPSEFPLHTLPSPSAGTLSQQSAYITARLTCEKLCGWTTPLIVDSDKEFRFGVFSPFDEKLEYSLVDPQGNTVPIENFAHPTRFQISSDGSVAVDGIAYIIYKPVIGTYQFTISSQEHIAPRENNLPHAALILWNSSPLEINTRVNSYSLKVGGDVGLVTDIQDTVAQARLRDVIMTAELSVIEPDGDDVDVPMQDDGLHYDVEANDGIYGAYIKPTAPGHYRLQATVVGKTGAGVEFMRTTEHVVPVIDIELSLETTATSQTDANKEILTIYLPVTGLKNVDSDSAFRPYAEVWGTDSNNNLVAACWISTITTIQQLNGAQVLPLQLNLKWLTLAKVQAPLMLKNVYVQESITHVPLSTVSEVAVKTPQQLNEVLAMPHLATVTEITKEMKVGKNPLTKPRDGKSGIVLVHGYCSDTNQFQTFGSDIFTDAHYFLNPLASIPNDEFANMIKDFAESQNLTSFGLIAHSQGGLASTHLHNYYWSGLELAEGGKLIQSVGSPYLGNAGAGCAAEIGKLFGITCGANTDLSVDGATLWLSGITSDTRKDVHFYTTTYEQGNFFGDWCSIAMNLLLKWPNDGVAEFARTQLPGANNMGNTQKWCHSVDLAYPPQCSDPTRNAEMNQNAAR